MRSDPEELHLGADRLPEMAVAGDEDCLRCVVCDEAIAEDSDWMEDDDGGAVCESCVSGIGDDYRDQMEDR